MKQSVLRATTLALLLCLAWIHPAQAQNDADNIRLIQEEAAAWSHNMDQLLSVFTDDVTYEDTPLGSTFRGKGELRAFAQGFFNAFPDLKAVISNQLNRSRG